MPELFYRASIFKINRNNMGLCIFRNDHLILTYSFRTEYVVPLKRKLLFKYTYFL